MEEVESEEEVRWGLTNPKIDNLFKHEDRIVYSNKVQNRKCNNTSLHLDLHGHMTSQSKISFQILHITRNTE